MCQLACSGWLLDGGASDHSVNASPARVMGNNQDQYTSMDSLSRDN